MGALASPTQLIHADFNDVGVQLSESNHHRRGCRAGCVHLRSLASPAGCYGGRPVRLLHTPAVLGFALTRLVGLLLREVVLTRDGVDGLMSGLLTSAGDPMGRGAMSGLPPRWLPWNIAT